MLTFQPFYIGGIEDLQQAQKNAYGGVGSFLLCFLLSVVYLVMDALHGDNESTRVESRHDSGVVYESVPTMTTGLRGPDLMLETTMDFRT